MKEHGTRQEVTSYTRPTLLERTWDQTCSDIIHPPPPPHQKSGQYASYWNAVLFSTAAEVVLPNLPHADKMQ